MRSTHLEYLRKQIADLRAQYDQAIGLKDDGAGEIAKQISVLELALAMAETYPASGPLDYAALRAKLYAHSPEEAAIAEALGLFQDR